MNEALERKQRSIQVLKEKNIPYIDHLPVIENEAEISQPITKDQVANRTMCLCAVALKGEGLEPKNLKDFINKYELEGHFTPKEQSFIDNPEPTEQEIINFTWKYEAYFVMLWALGFVEELDYPENICDVGAAVRLLFELSKDEFCSKAKLRPLSEILDETDLIYRYHWAVTEARLKQENPPGNLDAGVVYERHHALNWLIRSDREEWDSVSVHT